MNTRLFVLEDYKRTGKLSSNDLAKIEEAAAILRQGGLVAFPTETVYGLGGDARLKEAARRIYAAKGRPSDNPLIVHISSLSQLDEITAEIPETARRMAESCWPGPLTMVFRKSAAIPDETTGGLDTVAVRFPVDPVARELIARSGTVIAAPSANISGRPSTTSAEHCIEDLNGRIDAIVDGGPCDIGLESTILDVSADEPVLLRPGAVTSEMIECILGIRLREDAALKGPLAEGVKPKAPGMKYRHYAPKAPMVLVRGENAAARLAELIAEHKANGERTALICSEECLSEIAKLCPQLINVNADALTGHAADGADGSSKGVAADTGNAASTDDARTGAFASSACIGDSNDQVIVRTFGHRGDEAEAAHMIFELLREMDAENAEFIAAEGCGEAELGRALMNRMKKAAAWQVIDT